MTTFLFALILGFASLVLAPGNLGAATFGTPVAIGGQAADIALDEPRGVLYVADFTANRIDVMTLSDHTVHSSINVNPQPASLALSPDGQYLVIIHFGNFAAPQSSNNALTVINLATNARQVFGLSFPPLSVAFGNDGLALISTTTDFQLFNPATGSLTEIETISGLVANTLPQPLASFPPNIVQSSMNVNSDSSVIIGMTNTLLYSYYTSTHKLNVVDYVASPTYGPLVVSVSGDGSSFLTGWALYSCGPGGCLSGSSANSGSFINPSGVYNLGSHAIDSNTNTVYAQIPTSATASPLLMIADADNLTVRDTLQLPENLAGKSILNSAHTVMYSVSASGVMVLPIGTLSTAHRIQTSNADVIFRSNFCNGTSTKQTVTISDAGGGNIPFSVSTTTTGVSFSPSSGVTPATITVTVDPTQFLNQTGTTVGSMTIYAPSAVNVVPSVRLLVNTTQPDQRGTIIDMPGTLVDLLADPIRDQFYVLRQDNNTVYAFDGNYNPIGTLRTATTPTQMATTLDGHYLLVGHDNAQIVTVYDLNTMQSAGTIRMPHGHYPRSIGVSSRAILAASRVAGPPHTIDKIDMTNGIATAYPSLGVFVNSINANTVLQGAPNGTSIMGVMPDGNVLLYDATVDSFTISRKDFTALSGAYAVSSYGQFVVGNNLMNTSLVPVGTISNSTTAPVAGFAFTASGGALATGASSPSGMIQRVDPVTFIGQPQIRIVETPATNTPGFAFTRTIAPLLDGNSIVELTTSGIMALPAAFDAAVAPPKIAQIVNAADLTKPIAPGGLVSLFGSNLTQVNMATNQIPLPTALADSCMSVNGTLLPLLFASPTQINAQLPFNASGNSSLVLYTPGGISDTFNLTIQPTAPSVFRNSAGVATIIRNVDGQLITNNTPIHLNDYLTIYLTGMGGTTPSVVAGAASPSNPLAVAIVQPTITIGGSSIFVLWAGLAPKQVGVYQIDALVPFHGIPTGDNIAFKITQGSASTTILLKVEEN